MGSANLVDTLNSDGNGGGKQPDRNGNGGHRLCFSMSVGMVRVRRPHRNTKADEDYERTQYIGERLDRVRNQGIRVPYHPGMPLMVARHKLTMMLANVERRPCDAG